MKSILVIYCVWLFEPFSKLVIGSLSDENLKMTEFSNNHDQLVYVPAFRSFMDVRNTSSANFSSSSAVFCTSSSVNSMIKSMAINNADQFDSIDVFFPNQNNPISTIVEKKEKYWILHLPPSSSPCYLFTLRWLKNQTRNIDTIDVVFIYSLTSSSSPSSEMSNYRYNWPSPSWNTPNVCGTMICQNGGVCFLSNNYQYECRCEANDYWLGPDCSKPNPCQWNPCNSRGQCYYLPNALYYCVCFPGFTGQHCQTSSTPSINSQANNNGCSVPQRCLNGGTCLTGMFENQYTCLCNPNYTGSNCQTSLTLNVSTSSTTNIQCGISKLKPSLDFDRIVNGQSVYQNTWPWIVSIQMFPSVNHFCGGTLIDQYHVLTAAHCFDAAGISPSNVKVIAGLLNLQRVNEIGVQHLSVDQIFRHEKYSSRDLVNDITVIKLKTPAQISNTVYPICLPKADGSQDPKIGQNVQIAGWGYTSSLTKQLAVQLQEATIQILSMNDGLNGRPGCYDWKRNGYLITETHQVCAMSRDTRIDSCQGDSGGPLIRILDSRWYLFGIVSFGDPICASSTRAGVYTRVSAYSAWIQQKLKL